MSRWRLARITGAVLVLGTLFCGCGLLALARPTRPWYDVEAEQAAWSEFQTKVLVVGGLLILAGVALGVVGAIGEAEPLPLPPRLADPAAGDPGRTPADGPDRDG
ncbi:MAG: hypothetical protein WA890_05380 [Micromonospora sp.]